jgi:hypothetical protein
MKECNGGDQQIPAIDKDTGSDGYLPFFHTPVFIPNIQDITFTLFIIPRTFPQRNIPPESAGGD